MNVTDPKPSNSIWIWVGLAFGFMLAGWVAFFVITAHHKVEDVPIENRPIEAP